MFGGIPKTSPLQIPEPAFSPWAFKLGCSWPWGHPSTLNVYLGPAASLPGHVRPHSLPARLGFSEGSVKKPHAELCHVVHSRGHQGAPDRGLVSSGADSCLEAPVQRSAPCPSCDGRVWPWKVSCLPRSPKPLLRAGMGKRSTSRPRFPPDACLQRLLACSPLAGPGLSQLGVCLAGWRLGRGLLCLWAQHWGLRSRGFCTSAPTGSHCVHFGNLRLRQTLGDPARCASVTVCLVTRARRLGGSSRLLKPLAPAFPPLLQPDSQAAAAAPGLSSWPHQACSFILLTSARERDLKYNLTLVLSSEPFLTDFGVTCAGLCTSPSSAP